MLDNNLGIQNCGKHEWLQALMDISADWSSDISLVLSPKKPGPDRNYNFI